MACDAYAGDKISGRRRGDHFVLPANPGLNKFWRINFLLGGMSPIQHPASNWLNRWVALF
jgi:hypothetical protein